MVTKVLEHYNGEIIEWFWSTDNEFLTKPFFTSCYIIDGWLIDSCAPAGAVELYDFIKTIRNPTVQSCFITHNHEDHAGGGYLLNKLLGINLYSSEITSSIIRKGYTYPNYRQLAWGEKLNPTAAETIKSPFSSISGKYTFELVPMPGHAPGLTALIERNHQLVFVGDAVLPKFQMLFGKTSSIQENIYEIYCSIKNLYEITDGMGNLLIFISGKGVFLGRKFLLERIKEIEVLHEKTHRLSEEGLNKSEILNEIFRGEGFIGETTQGELSRINLIESLLKWEI